MEWAIAEMRTINLCDERLNKKLISLLDTLRSHPQDSIPAACRRWSETKVAHLFFDNEQMDSEKILSPHCVATIERVKQKKIVLLVQDTTTLNFSG